MELYLIFVHFFHFQIIIGLLILIHIDNKSKDILILGKGPTQGLDNTILTAEAEYSVNFSR